MTRFIEQEGGTHVVCECNRELPWRGMGGKYRVDKNAIRFLTTYFALCPWCEIIYMAKGEWFKFSERIIPIGGPSYTEDLQGEEWTNE